MKYFIIITLLSLVFSYIDQTCNAGKLGYGVCVKKSSCVLYGNQKGSAYAYIGSAPRWPCPNDPSDVICCVKQVTRLRDGITYKTGRCLNVKQCKGSVVNTAECPGSNKVKLCVTGGESETSINSVYKVNVNQGGNLNIRSGPSTNHDILGTISSSQYIFATAKTSNGWVKFYKGYLSENYLLKVNSNANYKVNTDGLNFRVGPGTSYNIVSTLTYGNQIVYYSRDPWNSNWAVTNKGYCSASYITSIKDTPTPTPTPTPSPKSAGDISTKFGGTVLNRNSFINKVSSYCQNHKGTIASALCNNAGTVYDISKETNTNALLVIARAIVEGNSPGASKNNYWGIGCVNGGGTSACKYYKSLEDGIRGFAKTISGYNNLAEMQSKYTYIGKYWYNPGSWALGGCKYFSSIKQYMSPQRRNTVSIICNKSTQCTKSGGDCTPTTNEDQKAYATWQVEQKMAPTIRNVFGVY